MTKSELDYEVFRIRQIELEIAKRYPEGEMRCPVHLSIGQEAQAVGVGKALRKTDLMVSTHRSHAHYLAKGGDLKRMICELYGKAEGCSRGQGGSMHLVDWVCGFAGSTSIVGGTIPIGVGLGFAAKIKGEDTRVAICLGDAAIEEGIFHESANFASLHKLNMIFVVENNRYSCYTPIQQRRSQEDFHAVAAAHDLEYLKITNNDVELIFDETKAIMKCSGPFLLELDTYRMIEHCGPNNDDNLNYRPEEEIAQWRDRDPTLNMNISISDKAKIFKEIKDAFSYAKNAPYPKLEELGKYTYA